MYLLFFLQRYLKKAPSFIRGTTVNGNLLSRINISFGKNA